MKSCRSYQAANSLTIGGDLTEMAEEYPCLEGEDEYLEDLDHQSDCGTQLDGDDIIYAHESYNYTQIDDADEERAGTSSASDKDHEERSDTEHCDFPDLAVTQTQRSQCIIDADTMSGHDATPSTHFTSIGHQSAASEDAIIVAESAAIMTDDLMVERANYKDTVIDIEPRDASQSLLQEEQDDDKDDDNFVDICVTDTQQYSSIPSSLENATLTLTSGACDMDASANSASTTFSIPNHSSNVGKKTLHSHNNDDLEDKGIQEPDPSQRSPPPSPSPFHFPYTSDSVCGTPLKTEKCPSPSRSTSRIIASAEMAAESQSSCTGFSQRGVREKPLPLSQPGSVEPGFNEQGIAGSDFYEKDIAESEQDVAESEFSQVYQTSQQRPSSGVAANASQTAQTSIAGESTSASLRGGEGCGSDSSSSGPRSPSIQSVPKAHKKSLSVRPEEEWMESRATSAPSSLPLEKCAMKADSVKHQVPSTAPSSSVLRTASSSTNSAVVLTGGGGKEERQRNELVARKSALFEEYKRKEAELKAQYLQQMNDLGINDQEGGGEGGEGEGVATPPETVTEIVPAPQLVEAVAIPGVGASVPSRMFHTVTVRRSDMGASPIKSPEEEAPSRKPKRRFARSPREGEGGFEVGSDVPVSGAHLATVVTAKPRSKDVFSFEDSQAVDIDVDVDVNEDEVEDIVDTDEESETRGRESGKGVRVTLDRIALEDAATQLVTAVSRPDVTAPSSSSSSSSSSCSSTAGRLVKGKKPSPKRIPKGVSVSSPSNTAGGANEGAGAVVVAEEGEVTEVPVKHEDDVPLSVCVTMKWKEAWNILKSCGWTWKRGSGMVEYFYLRPGHTIHSPHGEYSFHSTAEVWAFITSVCERRNRANKKSRSVSPVQVESKMVCLSATVKTSKSAQRKAPSAKASDAQDVMDFEEVEVKGKKRDSSGDWLSRIMTIPWKVLYIEHLSKEGWTWNYGTGLEHMCYYAPGFGPIEDFRRKDMTEQQVLDQERREPILNVSKFTSEDELRRFLRRTRCASYKPSEQSQMEEAEAVASFGDDWNLTRNRKRRKSAPFCPYSSEEYINNTCDMSQTLHEATSHVDSFVSKGKKRKGIDDGSLDKGRKEKVYKEEKGITVADCSPVARKGKVPISAAHDGHEDIHRHSAKPDIEEEISEEGQEQEQEQRTQDGSDDDDRPIMDVYLENKWKSQEKIILSASRPAPNTSSSRNAHSGSDSVNSHNGRNNCSSAARSHDRDRDRDHRDGRGSVSSSLQRPHGRQHFDADWEEDDDMPVTYRALRQVMMGMDSQRRRRMADSVMRGVPAPESNTQQQDLSPETTSDSPPPTSTGRGKQYKDANSPGRKGLKKNLNSNSPKLRPSSSEASSSKGRHAAPGRPVSSSSTPRSTFQSNLADEVVTKKVVNQPSFTVPKPSAPTSHRTQAAVSVESKKKGGSSMLFSGMTFILSGICDAVRDALSTRILKCGGKVVSELPFLKGMKGYLDSVQRAYDKNTTPPYSDPSVKVGLLSEKIVLLSRPTNFRKSNYLLVLATGGTLLHHMWAAQCMDSNTVLPHEGYELPSGASALLPHYVFTKENTRQEYGVLTCLRVLNFAGSQWAPLLAVCGMHVAPHDDVLLNAFAPGKIIDRRKYSVDIVVVDCLSYSDIVSKKTLGKAPGKKGAEQSGLSLKELAAIEGCVEREGLVSVKQGGIKVVTIDWVVHCLQLGEQVPFDSNDIFSLPVDPINRPLGYKNVSKRGNGERFMKYDVCYYRRLNEEKEQLGQVRAFSRKNPSAPMQVRIRPLLLSGGSKAIRTQAEEEHSASRDICHTVTSDMAAGSSSKKGADALWARELTPSEGKEEVMMDASVLTRKAAVLSQSEAKRAVYALCDQDVFVSSVEWERSYGIVPYGEEEEGTEDSAPMRAQMSQDY